MKENYLGGNGPRKNKTKLARTGPKKGPHCTLGREEGMLRTPYRALISCSTEKEGTRACRGGKGRVERPVAFWRQESSGQGVAGADRVCSALFYILAEDW